MNDTMLLSGVKNDVGETNRARLSIVTQRS